MADKLSDHNVKGVWYGYKRMIGGKRFYFSRDLGIDRASAANHRRAQTAASIYAAEWDRLKGAGAKEWTAEALERARGLIRNALGLPHVAAAPATEAPARSDGNAASAAPASASALRLHAAADAYVLRRRQQAAAGQISAARADTIDYALRRFKLYAPDRPLASFGLDECRAFVNHFASRPTFQKGAKQGSRMAPDTVADTIVLTRGFFSDAADRGDWQAPASLDKCFGFDRDKLVSEQEYDERAKVKTFAVAELATLWRATRTDRQRLYILLGLNCGFTQKEIATLRKAHCHLDATDKQGNPRPFIQRRRNKTRAKVKTVWRWRLWDETASLLRKEMARDNADGLALLSDRGGKLCDVTASSRYDLVRGQWVAVLTYAQRIAELTDTTQAAADALTASTSYEQLKERTAKLSAAMAKQEQKGVAPAEVHAPVRALGFKFLRKTAANMIRKIAGKDTAETFLAHSESGMGKHYHNPDFKRVAKALRTLRRRLDPMFATKPTETADAA